MTKDLTCPYCHGVMKYMGVGEPKRYQCSSCGAVIQEICPPMKIVEKKFLW